MKNKIKVFIGLREVAGYFSNLKAGFEEIGIYAVFLNLGGNRFNYSEGKNPRWILVLNYIGRKIGSNFSNNFVLRFIWLTVFQNIFSLVALFIALFKYDVFIMGSNSTFFYFLELPFLKLLKKKIIYVFLGSDSRPLYLNGYAYNGRTNPNFLILLTKIQKQVVKIIEKYADIVINHPPQAHFHEKPFVSFLKIGIPYKEENKSVELKNLRIHPKTIKIVHIPSKSGPKGSEKFKDIIIKLKEIYLIEYIEISGIPNSKVIDIISNADIAFDEFYSDTPMSVFGTECAFQGVPVVVGSYYAAYINQDYKKLMQPPSMFVLPEDLEQAIIKLIIDIEYREQLGKDAFDFVSHNWLAKIVAKKYLKLISGDFPKKWLYDPYSLSYIYGCGLSKDQVTKNISTFVDKRGIKALCLMDKPHLEREFLDIIRLGKFSV